jgi:putative FmdB family regulatory protein
MPIYENECRGCGAQGTYFSSVDDRKKTPKCNSCGGDTEQIISAVRGFADIPAYVSPATGRLISGRRARRYDLESSGCRPYEGTDVEAREAKRHREHESKKLEAKLEDTLGRTIEDLDASNKLEVRGERNDPLPSTDGMRVLY